MPYSYLGQKSSADDARKRHVHHFRSGQISWCSRNYWRLLTNRWILEEDLYILIVLAGAPAGRTPTITTRQKFLRADPGLEAVERGWNGLRP